MHWSQQTPSSNNIRDYSTMDITRGSIPKSDWLYSLQPKMEKLYTVSKNKIWSSLWLRSWQLITKFRLKLKKEGKTTKPFRYDLNQIPYDYTVEVRNRFKGLDLVDLIRCAWRTMDEVHNTVQEEVIKTIPKEKMQKGKMAVWGGLTNSWERREAKGKGERERYIQLTADFPRIARSDTKAFLSEQCKEIEGKTLNGKV